MEETKWNIRCSNTNKLGINENTEKKFTKDNGISQRKHKFDRKKKSQKSLLSSQEITCLIVVEDSSYTSAWKALSSFSPSLARKVR